MTHRERLLAVMRRETPDVVPVTWELVGRFATAQIGNGSWRAQVEAHRRIGSAVFNLQGVGPHLSADLPDGYESNAQTVAQPDGTILMTGAIVTPGGTLTSRMVTNVIPGDPTTPKVLEYFVKERADYDILEDYVVALGQAQRADTTASDEARELVGEDGLVNFWMGDALYYVAHHRRDEEFILDLVDIPDRIERLLEAVDAVTANSYAAFNASAADALVYDVCWGSTSVISPAMVDRFVIPRASRLREQISSDKIWGFFTTGRTRDVVPQLVDCEPAFIQHFDVLGDCDLAEIKKTFGGRICVMGNYSPVVLARGTLDDARREAKRCLDAAMAGGGYAITTSDEVPADAKIDNMKAVVEYVNEHGRY